MTNQHLFLDIHAIQTLPPSNINRDDTGSPKTAQYGGVRRARVSSQSWKKAMREYFHKNSAQSNVGVRTLEIVRYIADKIKSYDSSKEDSEAMELAERVLNEAKVKTKEQRAKALFFLGDTQAEKLAEAAVSGEKDKKQLQEILRDKPAVDIALFGRMVADDPSLNEDASSQVAHAISTHAVQTEFDFYTAVDDLAPEDNAGAGMLGTLEFNSSTLYRYANVAVHELLRQLNNKETAINTLRLFIEAFSNSMPTGKVNSYANQTLPQAIVVNLRTDRPVNLVSAFEEPVKASNGNVSVSIQKLFNELRKVEKFVKEPEYTFYLTMEDVENHDVDGVNEESLNTLLEHFAEVTNNLMPAEVGE
ncbi:type I-E CRISPR-associated protein Cas7/Cse4/CasC [Tetragenococcus halophilus]|mgnify:CR=1 FL=1|uniref:Type I-E CRISPR-associated protein Cas7/Cse4/CasC n=1 Tax=Tetragenococcus halophilus TaxID=51669 RepID=A0AB37D396_TETHA|nr:type I-E CRISPR-associated protein Cas7/Cse4/CasC [Tetragenococcus halophilus]MDN6146426.1 type I-E CRISPR-associated protein Cas7/Cse4/CasC [Tetragenococcus koreensis]MDN6195277.1 type I-E CRISPR-associated protein Cas7/Cse4/CasC [Atopostipes suicloacalis]MDN6629811.1 type I-E CRISPR-associated protein Cas7/Cse4/CasC [Staphylococcus equorum]MCF1675464.1 type I-E CRISPR-associated protein Cas7/Cse4/CasC [Tetragenococcus halophilus]MCO7025652.1 type I-E CRISPR-associated protein Cas7/Cse4/Ca